MKLEEKQDVLKNVNLEDERTHESDREEMKESDEIEKEDEIKEEEEEEEFVPLEAIYWIGVLRPHTYPTRSRNGSPLLEMGRPIKEFKFNN